MQCAVFPKAVLHQTSKEIRCLLLLVDSEASEAVEILSENFSSGALKSLRPPILSSPCSGVLAAAATREFLPPLKTDEGSITTGFAS